MTRVGLRDVTNALPHQQAGNVANKNTRKSSQKQQPPGQHQIQPQPGQTQKHSVAVGSTINKPDVVGSTAGVVVHQQHQAPSQSQQKEEAPLPDPQEAPEYAQIIYEYLRKTENVERLRVTDPEFLENQKEISSRMRGILLDWLVEVHYKFKLVPETLYLCINLIDRFLDRDRTIPRKKLQLVGGTCMLIASKYEEFRPPEVGDICYIMDNAYTREDILEMEVQVLNKLKFEVTVPSALQFLEYFIKKMSISREDDHFFLAQYLVEATLLEVKFLKYKPSHLASAALYLANRIRKHAVPWPPVLVELTGLGEQESVKPLAKEIFEMIPNFRNKSLYKKYTMEKYHGVAPTIPAQ